MNAMRTLSALALLVPLAACTTVSSVDQSSGSVRTQPAVDVAGNTTVSAETAGVAGALAVFGHPVNALGLPGEIFSAKQSALLYIIYDPLAPNWTIKESPMGNDTYHYSLRAKSFRTGGDGEALRILKRRVSQLQHEKGFTSYQILDYSEGIESSTPLTHRFSEGTVQLVRVKSPTDAGANR